ncbi:MAG: hypothetical protein ABIE68_04020 [bacterium]
MKFDPNKIFVFFSPLILLAGTEYVLRNPRSFIAIFAAIILLTSIMLLGIIKPHLRQKEKLKNFILPILYIISLGSFVALLRNEMIAHIFLVIASLIYGWMLFVINNMMTTSEGKQKEYYGKYFEIFILFTFFFFVSAIYSFRIFLDLPPWSIMLPLFLISAALFYERLWIYDVMKREWWKEVVIIGFLIAEVGWVIMFWPITNLAIAFTILTVYFALSQIMAQSLTYTLNRAAIIRTLTISLIAVIITISTSQWTI